MSKPVNMDSDKLWYPPRWISFIWRNKMSLGKNHHHRNNLGCPADSAQNWSPLIDIRISLQMLLRGIIPTSDSLLYFRLVYCNSARERESCNLSSATHVDVSCWLWRLTTLKKSEGSLVVQLSDTPTVWLLRFSWRTNSLLTTKKYSKHDSTFM